MKKSAFLRTIFLIGLLFFQKILFSQNADSASNTALEKFKVQHLTKIIVNRPYSFFPKVDGIPPESMEIEWLGPGSCKNKNGECTIRSSKTGVGVVNVYDKRGGRRALKWSKKYLIIDVPEFEIGIEGVLNGGKIGCDTLKNLKCVQLFQYGKPTESTIISFGFSVVYKRGDVIEYENIGPCFSEEILSALLKGCSYGGSAYSFIIFDVKVSKPDGTIVETDCEYIFRAK